MPVAATPGRLLGDGGAVPRWYGARHRCEGGLSMNVLVVMSDQHNPTMLGCAGHQWARTPNLDALAAEGTRFTAAYTNSPICVPARAAWATGRYAYEGEPPGWGHALQAAGV